MRPLRHGFQTKPSRRKINTGIWITPVACPMAIMRECLSISSSPSPTDSIATDGLASGSESGR